MDGKAYGFYDLVQQMRAVNTLLARLVTQKDGMKQKEVILMLKDTELPAGEIARIVGTTLNTVQVTISQAKNVNRPAKKKPKMLEDKSNER